MKEKIEKGQRFGHWQVLGPSSKPYYYTCKCCKCGAVKDVYKSSLILGKSSQCSSCASSVPRPKTSKNNQKKAEERYLGKMVNGWPVIEILPPRSGSESLRCRTVCPVCQKETVTALSRLSVIKHCATCNRDIKQKSDAIHTTAWADGSSLAAAKSRMSGTVNRNSATGANGVSKLADGRYRAYINFRRKQYYLGQFLSLEDAMAARKAAEQLIYGDYLNQHEGWEDALREALKKLKDTQS